MARTDAQALTFGAGTTCSRCSAAPLVMFSSEKLSLDLPFCGHDATKNQAALAAQGFTVTVDLRPGAVGPTEDSTLTSV